MNLQENISRIKQMMGLLNEDTKKTEMLFSEFLGNDKSLWDVYNDISKKLNDKFTIEHFLMEYKYSGGLKSLAGGILPQTQKAYDKLNKSVGGKLGINSGYRSYQKQGEIFIQMANKYGGTISGGLKQAALPGFSEHHTGRALDISGYDKVDETILKKYGFVRNYLKPIDNFRMSEPWHIYYKGDL